MQNAAVIEEMKQWCMDNYTKGADTMVECWDTSDYEQLIADCGGKLDGNDGAWAVLKAVAGVYEDRQANDRIEGAL